MPVIRDIAYAPRLGDAGMLDLYLPEQADACPLLFYFHGGGLCNGNRGGGDYPLFLAMAEKGIAVASVEYRMYRYADQEKKTLAGDSAHYPDFIEDCAEAVAYLKAHGSEYHAFSSYYIGGSSAGGYLTMMLFFDKRYLGKWGLDPREFDGYWFDAGQPTVHFNVLVERGLDSRLVRLDEAAPIFWIDTAFEADKRMPKILIVYSEFDMENRPEQTRLLYRTMLHFGYDPEKLILREMKGFGHCAYLHDTELSVGLVESLVK